MVRPRASGKNPVFRIDSDGFSRNSRSPRLLTDSASLIRPAMICYDPHWNVRDVRRMIMRKTLCITIAAIGFGMVETGTAEAQAQAQCKPGQVYNGRSCVTPTTKRTERAVTNPEPAAAGLGYRRNPGNPCGDPNLTIQEGACRGY